MPDQVSQSSQPTEQQLKFHREALQISKKAIGQALISPGGPRTISPKDIVETGRQIRDKQLHQFPILPGAINVYQQIASSRDWQVSGRPRGVSRSIEWINNAQTFDAFTGQTYHGFQQYLQRRALDYLTIGRTSILVKNSSNSPLEYVDPGYLRFQRKRALRKKAVPITPAEKVWGYLNGMEFRSDEIHLDHAQPIGTHLFISPIAYILPSAHLAWLLREHHTTQLDGRKIRDIIMVSGNGMSDGIQRAIVQQAALWQGATPDRVGIPVVEVQNSSGVPLTNLFATLGLSQIPEKFDIEAFYMSYSNQISAGLGLSLAQFWVSEAVSNRALEDVQEQRQQQKGPAFFIRAEQRLMNNTGILDRFGRGVNRVRFGFVEESDLSTKLNNAKVLRETAQALKDIGEVFGDTITSQSYLAWMQNLGALPYEVELVAGSTVASSVATGEQDQMNSEEDTTLSGDEQPSAFDSKTLNYEEITMDQDGHVLEKRLKVFSVIKLLANEMYKKNLKKEQPQSDEEAFDLAIQVSNGEYQDVFREAYSEKGSDIDLYINATTHLDLVSAETAVSKCVEHQDLTIEEQEIIDILVLNLDLEKVGI